MTGFSLILLNVRESHRVPHKWLSSGLMSQCLAIQLSMYSRGFQKDPSTIYDGRRAKSQGSQRNFLRKFVVVVKQRQQACFWFARKDSNYRFISRCAICNLYPHIRELIRCLSAEQVHRNLTSPPSSWPGRELRKYL